MIFNVPREEKEVGRLCCSVGLGPAVQGGNGKAEGYFCPFYFYWSTSCSVGLFNNQGQNSVPSFTPGTKCICNDLSLYLSLSRRHLLGPDKRSISALALTKADQPLLMGDKQLQMEQREPAEFRPVCPG